MKFSKVAVHGIKKKDVFFNLQFAASLLKTEASHKMCYISNIWHVPVHARNNQDVCYMPVKTNFYNSTSYSGLQWSY